MEKLTVKDILSIKPGQTKMFVLPNGKAAVNGRALAYQQPITNPRADVEKYSCIISLVDEGAVLSVTAKKRASI